MAIRKLEQSTWRTYFDRISKRLLSSKVEIRIEGEDMGDQIEAQNLPLDSLSYDPSNNTLEIAAGALHHRISQPREIYVDDDSEGIRSLQVVDADGRKQIVQLSRSLSLPPS